MIDTFYKVKAFLGPSRPLRLNAARQAYLKNKERARTLVIERLEFFNAHYKFNCGRVSIRNQKTRWGSCSRKGNLNFNYRIIYLPAALQDYIVVHELCHLQAFNHAPEFWALVAETFPNYAQARRTLRQCRWLGGRPGEISVA